MSKSNPLVSEHFRYTVTGRDALARFERSKGHGVFFTYDSTACGWVIRVYQHVSALSV